MFVRDLWQKLEKESHREDQFSSSHFRSQLVDTFLEMSNDPNEGQMPIIYVTRESTLYYNTGKGRRVYINPNRAPSRRALGVASIPPSWTRNYVNSPPAGLASVRKERDNFYQLLGDSGWVFSLRILLIGMFQKMAEGISYNKAKGTVGHRSALSVTISDGQRYEYLHDTAKMAQTRMENTAKKIFMTKNVTLEGFFSGSHLAATPKTQQQWKKVVATFDHQAVRNLFSSAQNGQISTLPSSLSVFVEQGSSRTWPANVQTQLDSCRLRRWRYWKCAQSLLKEGYVTREVTEVMVEMRQLYCRLRSIRWNSTVNDADFARTLLLEDRNMRITETQYANLLKDSERILGYFRKHNRFIENNQVKIRGVHPES